MLTSRLIGDFRELANEFLEHRPHLGVVDLVGVEVDLGELLGHHVEQAVLGQPVHVGVEVEPLEDVTDGRRECLDVGKQVRADVVLIAHQPLHVELRGIVEARPGFAQEERLGVQALLGPRRELLKHPRLGRLKNAVEAAQDGEWEDDATILGLLVVAPQDVRHGPDEGGECLLVHVWNAPSILAGDGAVRLLPREAHRNDWPCSAASRTMRYGRWARQGSSRGGMPKGLRSSLDLSLCEAARSGPRYEFGLNPCREVIASMASAKSSS